MKLKDIFAPLIFIAIGIAFLVVSLWVFLSKSKNAKAIKYKYKLGGIILTLTFFTYGCSDGSKTKDDGEIVTCYISVSSDSFMIESDKETYYIGDVVSFSVYDPTFKYYSYQIMDSISKNVVQEGLLNFFPKDNQYIILINPMVNYTDTCEILIYGESSKDIKQERYIQSFRLEITKKEY